MFGAFSQAFDIRKDYDWRWLWLRSSPSSNCLTVLRSIGLTICSAQADFVRIGAKILLAVAIHETKMANHIVSILAQIMPIRLKQKKREKGIKCKIQVR